MLENLSLKSFAKINLFLHILNKRDDGYHNISSLLCGIDLFDQITFKKSKKFEVNFVGPESKKISDDNITKLITYLKRKDFIDEFNYQIQIDKNIPVGAGLGGGSSNLATVINTLVKNKIINKSVDIVNIVRSMGSDIEFFLYNKFALVEEKGIVRKLFNIKKSYNILLINPKINLSTKEVYKLNTSFSSSVKIDNLSSLEDINTCIHKTHNDLESAAIHLCPDIAIIRDEIMKQENLITCRMTGSGSTYFAIFSDKQSALKAEKYFNNNRSNWWTSVVRTI